MASFYIEEVVKPDKPKKQQRPKRRQKQGKHALPIEKLETKPEPRKRRPTHIYNFRNNWDRTGHFWFDKGIIKNLTWAGLPKATKAVFPVIASYRNSEGLAYPNELIIAILSGLSEKTTIDGIRCLEWIPGVKVDSYITERGRRAKKYIIPKAPLEDRKAFPFHREIFECGNWRQLTQAGRSLYPVMRCFGYHGFYDDDEETAGESEEDFKARYAARQYDFCNAQVHILAEHAGLSLKSVYNALDDLQRHHLLARDEEHIWRVYLHPTHFYKREWLNEQIRTKWFAYLFRGDDD